MEVPDKLRVAIELAVRTERAGGRVGTFAKEMTRLLREAEASLLGMGSSKPVVRRRKEGLIYTVDAKGEALIESRSGGRSNAFRCPKGLYDAMVTVLASADRAMAVEEIAVEVAKVLGEAPADHQVRVVLRLWLSVDPTLISRNRARYRSTSTQSLVVSANTLWNHLRTS